MPKLVWAFDLEAGSENVDDDIGTEYVDSLTTCPKEFSIQFNQRSREHKKVIREEFEASNIVLEKHE